MANTLTEDIIYQILLRLPVKSLVRFTCVSKSWAALIYSSSFAKSHLKQSTITKSVIDIVFERKWYSVKLSQLSNEGSGADEIVVEEIIKHPFNSHKSDMDYFHEEMVCPIPADLSGMDYFHIVGSCNGLLYLVKRCFSEDAVLFNPLTKTYCKIPNITFLEGLHSSKRSIDDFSQFLFVFLSITEWFWGCVYDEVNDDYKVVGIYKVKKYFKEEEFETSGWIYSPKSGSWRRIADMPSYNIAAPKWGAYVCNALHWVIYDGPSSTHRPRNVAAMDMGTEKFRLLPLPEYFWNESFTSYNLEVLDGCLCFCCNSNEDDYLSFEIWMMREYGTENGCNWDRLIKLHFYPEHRYFRDEVIKPLALFEDGKLLLVYVFELDTNRSCSSRRTLLWYDVETGSIKSKFNLPDNLGLGGPHPHVHTPSLVNPNPID